MNQILGESNLEYEERIKFTNFLESKKIKNKENIAKIWCNIKFRKCKYSKKIFSFIIKLDKEYSN